MTSNEKAVVDGERYALWPDGTFCRIEDTGKHIPALGRNYQEVIAIGSDNLLPVCGQQASSTTTLLVIQSR